MSESLEMTPLANGVVADVAFNEVKAALHLPRLEVEWFVRSEFCNEEVAGGDQFAVGAKNQVIGAGIGVDISSEVHAEGLNDWYGGFIDDALIEGSLSNFEPCF